MSILSPITKSLPKTDSSLVKTAHGRLDELCRAGVSMNIQFVGDNSKVFTQNVLSGTIVRVFEDGYEFWVGEGRVGLFVLGLKTLFEYSSNDDR